MLVQIFLVQNSVYHCVEHFIKKSSKLDAANSAFA